MPKWKYQVPQKKKDPSVYFRMENEKKYRLLISDWNFEKNPYTDSLFSCSVKKLNGEDTDKIWTVWNFDLKEALKKKLKAKNSNKDMVEITVTKYEKDLEESFELGK